MKLTLATFTEIHRNIRDILPRRLRTQDVGMIIRILTACNGGPGMVQNDVQQKLGLKQAALSKLVRKLTQEGMIISERSVRDRRIRISRTTKRGKNWLTALHEQFKERGGSKSTSQQMEPETVVNNKAGFLWDEVKLDSDK